MASTKFGGAYSATFTPPSGTASPIGSTAQGFLMSYNILHQPFGEDFFGQVATVGTILKGAEVTITLVGLDWDAIAPFALTGVGVSGSLSATTATFMENPFQYVGRDGYDLSGALTLTPYLSAYATNLPALTPKSVIFGNVLPVGPVNINLNSDLRVTGIYCLCFPSQTSTPPGQIFTWTV